MNVWEISKLGKDKRIFIIGKLFLSHNIHNQRSVLLSHGR
ncbi:MAG: DUF4431 domain-containing protein [Pedobacter agri]